MMKYLIIFIVFVGLFASCSKSSNNNDDDEKIRQQNDELISNYINLNNLENVNKTSSGLYYQILVEGNGTHPKIEDEVKVLYRGYFLNDSEFDSSSSPIEFSLREVIKGWQEGIPYLSVGGKGRFLIPSHLAYGKSGSRSIPPNTPLIFDVTLLEIK